MTLPPLPEPKPFKEWTGAYDNADMKAYGQQCREAALEEAAKVCVSIKTTAGTDDVERGFNAALNRAANAIRSLK